MKVSEIIKQVRYCIDEEYDSVRADYEDGYMNNIIKAKIYSALRWCCLNADSSFLTGSDEDASSPRLVKSYCLKAKSETLDVTKSVSDLYDIYVNGTLCHFDDKEVPEGSAIPASGISTTDIILSKKKAEILLNTNPIKIIRTRIASWHKAVMEPVEEDSDAYIMLSNPTAGATIERPQSAIIQSYPMRLEMYPWGQGDIEWGAIDVPSFSTGELEDDSVIAIPPKIITAMLYYIAFLLLSAYQDARAEAMLDIAKIELGTATTNE